MNNVLITLRQRENLLVNFVMISQSLTIVRCIL